MACNYVDAGMITKMFLAGAQNLEAQKERINELNVFPVPDGDTGTNMTMTILSAAKEVAALEEPNMESVAKAIASGSLRGARGNSGVILSQLFRGFTKGIKDYEKVTIPVFTDAFTKAVETAYKAVMKPKEGTILTVARAGADKAVELEEEGEEDLEVFFREVIGYMDDVLGQTTEMLPVLAQAGVVDSGGQGLVEILRGAYDAFLGKEIVYEPPAVEERPATAAALDEADIRFGYCTEFIIMLQKPAGQKKIEGLKKYLESIGDSLVVVADEEVIKVHVHTNDPGLAIQRALRLGALSNMKIDNMRLEHQEKLFRASEKQEKQEEEEKPELSEKKAVGFVAVSIGDGLGRIFRELGVDYIIEGGQTMNPSTEDILDAVSHVRAETIYIFPNNSNIVLAANQARDLTEDKHIVVIPTKNIPQGITAMINYIDGNSEEENEAAMTEAVQQIKSGQVTYAVRDTSIDGKEIKQGDIMGLSDKTIEVVGSDVKETTLRLIDALKDEETELITLYYGAESSEEEAKEIAAAVCGKYEEIEVETEYGGQPIYYYFISVE